MSMTLRLAKQLSIDLLQHGLIPRRFGAWSASVRVGLTYLAGMSEYVGFFSGGKHLDCQLGVLSRVCERCVRHAYENISVNPSS